MNQDTRRDPAESRSSKGNGKSSKPDGSPEMGSPAYQKQK